MLFSPLPSHKNWQNDFLHDCNNALMVLQTHLAEIEDNYPNNEDVKICLTEYQNVKKTIASYLHLFAFEFGEMPDNVFAPMNASVILKRVCSHFPVSFFIQHIAEDILVSASEELLSWIFQTVLENAIESTDVKNRCIEITLHKKDKNLVFTCKDNGFAWDKEEQKYIFQKNTRTTISLDRGVRGSGLSLFLLKHYIELLKGTVVAHGIKNKGAQFMITIPLCKNL